jgi:uncharacterized membrane protein YtjA (UPF0391 family)
MLYWAAVFLVISIIAAVLGFGGIAGAAAGIAKILFESAGWHTSVERRHLCCIGQPSFWSSP